MKQLAIILLVCSILLGLVACGKVPENDQSTLASTIASIFTSSTQTSSTKQTVPSGSSTSIHSSSTNQVVPTSTPAPARPELPTEYGEPCYVKAPDFTVYDSNGEAVKLSDFAGTPVVLNFWASWCGPCKREMPDFQEAYDTYGEQLQFMMVSRTDGTRETVDTASSFISSEGYTFPYFCDTDRVAATNYNITAIPQTFFIDADGYIVLWYYGMIYADQLQAGLNMLLP